MTPTHCNNAECLSENLNPYKDYSDMYECQDCWAITAFLPWGPRLYMPFNFKIPLPDPSQMPKVQITKHPDISGIHVRSESALTSDAVETIRTAFTKVSEELGMPIGIHDLSDKDDHRTTHLLAIIHAPVIEPRQLQRFTVRTMYELKSKDFRTNNALGNGKYMPTD